MKQCYHNDLSKECAVLSNSERATFLLSLMQLPVQKAVGETQSFETFKKMKAR